MALCGQIAGQVGGDELRLTDERSSKLEHTLRIFEVHCELTERQGDNRFGAFGTSEDR
jgi:hypothetical protein